MCLSKKMQNYSVTGNEKYWSGLNTFVIKKCFSKSQKVSANIKSMQRQLWESCKLWYFSSDFVLVVAIYFPEIVFIPETLLSVSLTESSFASFWFMIWQYLALLILFLDNPPHLNKPYIALSLRATTMFSLVFTWTINYTYIFLHLYISLSGWYSCMNIAKTEDYDKIQKNDANTLSMLLSGQVANTSNLNYLLWNIEDPALRSNTALKKDYHPSLIKTFLKNWFQFKMLV